jgi:hypothetical protein
VTRLEKNVNEHFKMLCARLRGVLTQEWSDKDALDKELEDIRKWAEQVWLATHDPLNIHGTAVAREIDPQQDPDGANALVMHFQETAGELFATEFRNGLI